jgi:hypothetical protein
VEFEFQGVSSMSACTAETRPVCPRLQRDQGAVVRFESGPKVKSDRTQFQADLLLASTKTEFPASFLSKM